MTDSDIAPKSSTGRIARALARLRPAKDMPPPRRILILQPCCLGRAMLTTPLLAALSEGFPEARIDWAVSDWAAPAIAGNPRLTRIIRTGAGELDDVGREEQRALVDKIRGEAYDMCLVPSQSRAAQQIAARADIPRVFRLGDGRRATGGERLMARRILALAVEAGVDPAIVARAEMEFEPPDADRIAVARRLVEELDWLGDAPLAILHPGGGDNPSQTNLDMRWPAYRYARLANLLARTWGMRVIVIGVTGERAIAAQVAGMVSFPAANLAGELELGELGALSELADLYVGNHAGSTFVAAATGCPTLAIYGPTDPAVYGPYMINGRVRTLWRPYTGAFDWADGVSLEEAGAAAGELLTEQLQATVRIF